MADVFTGSYDGLNMPYSPEAEQAVLGAVILDSTVFDKIVDYIKSPDYFYVALHRLIFAQMQEMMNFGAAIDFVTLLEKLKQNKAFDEATGKTYLMDLVNNCPSISNAEAYAKVIADKYNIRMLITASREIIDDATSGDDDPAILIDSAEQKIFNIRQGNENDEIAVYRYVTKGTFDAYSWSLVENKQRFISQVMTSKSVSRSCEDIDEATLSYAEIKAVATGNPLIKEKMELDNEVQRLKLLKSTYDSQHYALQDNFMIRYPKLIAAAKAKLGAVRADMKVRDEELLKSEEFAITIGKATFTERVDGGTVMLEAISKCKTGETTALGQYKGFILSVEKNFLGVSYLVLQGRTEYKAELSNSPVGNMVKIENLFNNIQSNEEYLLQKIEQYETNMEESRIQYEKPFAYEQELKTKLARQYELNAALDLENKKVADMDLGGRGSDECVAESEFVYNAEKTYGR